MESIRILRTFHTIRHLQLRQAWYFFLRRRIGANKVKPSRHAISVNATSIHPALRITHADGDFHNYEFIFLNQARSFPRNEMDWRPESTSRLWRYNLHYFDFLRDPQRPIAQKIALISDWIEKNPQGSEPAWEPYTASLRIVNWCLFLWSLSPEQIPLQWLRSLHIQAHWLERNLELHILANHYFENIKAMLFASFFFDGNDSLRWRSRFQKKLVEQLHEQTLADGGHYERSPQYHCILLEDYLEIYALMSENTAHIEEETLVALTKTIKTGLQFLAAISTPDDDIPLLNDSASGAASRPSAIFKKASKLGFNINIPQSMLINLPESGLYGWKCGNDYFLIDCGDIGPAYQPGHTHCDFLSFVLMINGHWIIVDSGVCEYEPGQMRAYVRSTAAHNTVSVEGCEQSEIWGEFRVGRRASRIDASIEKNGNNIVFTGAFRGFPALKGGIVHRRCVTLDLAESGKILTMNITDTIIGNSRKSLNIESFLHLHPSLTCHATNQPNASGEISYKINDRLRVNGLSLSSSAKSWYCPQFGMAQPNQQLCKVIYARLPVSFSYQIQVEHCLL